MSSRYVSGRTDASNFIYESSLTDEAIVELENMKKETLLNVVNFLTQFIP